MYPSTHTTTKKFDDTFLLLDEEFDLEDEELSLDPLASFAHAGEIGWEDQLDNGEEMSL